MNHVLMGFVGLLLFVGCAPVSQKAASDDGRIAITVTEKGFEPEIVTASVGKPVTLVVTRTTAKTCATNLVMPAQGINQSLPLGEAVEITFTPDKAGELSYACAMDMFKGKVVVK